MPEEQELAVHQEAEIVPLAVVPLATDHDEPLNDEQLVLMALPKSALTPPKEKPPPPPVDDEVEQEIQSLSAGSIITSWMQKDATAPVTIALQTNGNTHDEAMRMDEHEQSMGRIFDSGNRQHESLGDVEQWRSLESYEVVQQVQHQQQLKQHEQEKEQERDKDQQEMLVYSNRIETLPSHHHQLYDPGEHEVRDYCLLEFYAREPDI
uniref:Uncharacterized protein n=1 Tax=Anopheles maculatus TaxID=74869 RepID=A0A182SQM9_9DIPT